MQFARKQAEVSLCSCTMRMILMDFRISCQNAYRYFPAE